MKMNSSKKLVGSLFIACSLISGCATEPGETTALGAAAGGAIGAGLGAIVGSQTGDVGSGLVIGAAAGTAAGAAVGNQIQAQDEEFDAQDEILQRRQRTLDSQRAEIDELKKLNTDTGSTQNASLKRQLQQISRESNNEVSPRASYRASSMDNKEESYKVKRVGSAAIEPEIPTTQRSLEEKPIVNKFQPELPVRSEELASDKLSSAKKTEVSSSEGKRLSSIFSATNSAPLWSAPEEKAAPIDTEKVKAALNDNNDVADITGESDSLPIVEEKASSKVAEKSSTTAKINNSASVTAEGTECQQADSEHSKSLAASESADQLFHLRRALRLCPQNAKYHVSLGDLYKKLKRESDAKFEYNEALKVEPNNAEAKKRLVDSTDPKY